MLEELTVKEGKLYIKRSGKKVEGFSCGIPTLLLMPSGNKDVLKKMETETRLKSANAFVLGSRMLDVSVKYKFDVIPVQYYTIIR